MSEVLRIEDDNDNMQAVARICHDIHCCRTLRPVVR
jgi:hypothetical protein